MGIPEFAGGARERRHCRGLDVALSRRRPLALPQAWRVRRRRRRAIASRSAKWSGSTRPRPPSSRSTRAATRRSARAPIAPTICRCRRIGPGKVGSWTRSGGRSTARASSSAETSPSPLDAAPPPPLSRGRVHAPLRTGVRVVDLFTPLCLGQRVGVFAGSGIGKSSLLAMLARATPDRHRRHRARRRTRS